MPEEFDDQPSEGIDFAHYLALARRRAWYFLPPLFFGWLVVWLASWVMPSVYRSGTLILVEQPTVPQQYVVPNINGSIENRLDSITQQILSRTRLLHIIDKLNLYAKDRARASPDELVERMRKDIEIELVRSPGRDELTSFNVYYSSRDAHVAQEVTSELTNLFISENLEVRQQQSENTTKFLANQLEEARRNLAEQEEKVREFKDKHLGELPGQLQSNLQILSGLQGQLQTEEDTLNRAKQQNVYLESLLGQYRAVRRTAKTGDNTVVGLPALDQELDKLKAQLADLSSHYTDRHPDVRKVKEQIAKTERLKQQIAANLQSGASDPPANAGSADSPKDDAEVRDSSPMMELQSQLKANQIEIASRQRSIQDLKARIGDYQGRLNQAPVREQQLTDLTRGYDQSKADYDSLLRKKNDSELATSLELQQQGEHFRILDPPNVPDKPFSPNRLKLFGIGLVAGLALGGVFAAGAELTDDRIHSEKEFKKLVTANVMVEIPALISPDEEKARIRRLWLGWLGAGFMAFSIFAGFVITYFRG
jgi:polysaccharide chain length determinant protein (PEP-CTERM system associated)